jgi:hypothetical protein
MELDEDALEHMTHTLQKFTYSDLSQAERRAAATLLQTLPRDTLIKDFMHAASPSAIARAGLPASVAEGLKPLLSRLELNLCYAGQFAAMFDAAAPSPQHL